MIMQPSIPQAERSPRKSYQSKVQPVHGILLCFSCCIIAFIVFVLGMMLLSVMGGVNAGRHIPPWYNLAMWIGWPASLVAAAISPSIALWVTNSWRWPLRLLVAGTSISFVWFAIGLALMVSYGTRS